MTCEQELLDLLLAHDEWVRCDEALDAYEWGPTFSARWRADRAWKHYQRLREQFRARLRGIDFLMEHNYGC